MSNIFKLYPTHFSKGEKFSREVSPPLVTGLAANMQISNSSLLFKRVAATEVTALCKKQTTPDDRIASDTNCFHRMQTRAVESESRSRSQKDFQPEESES